MYSTFSRRRQLHWTNDKLPMPVAREKDQRQHRGLLPANKSVRKSQTRINVVVAHAAGSLIAKLANLASHAALGCAKNTP